MKKMFVDWIKLLILTIIVFIITIIISSSIFCRPFFPFCLVPMIGGILIAGIIALLISFIVYMILSIKNRRLK